MADSLDHREDGERWTISGASVIPIAMIMTAERAHNGLVKESTYTTDSWTG